MRLQSQLLCVPSIHPAARILRSTLFRRLLVFFAAISFVTVLSDYASSASYSPSKSPASALHWLAAKKRIAVWHPSRNTMDATILAALHGTLAGSEQGNPYKDMPPVVEQFPKVNSFGSDKAQRNTTAWFTRKDIVLLSASDIADAIPRLRYRLHQLKHLRLVLFVPDPGAFDMLSFDRRITAQTMHYLVDLAREDRLSLLSISEAGKKQLVTNVAMVDVHVDWPSRIQVVLPVFPTHRKARRYGPEVDRTFSRIGTIYNPSETGRNDTDEWVKLFTELERSISERPAVWAQSPSLGTPSRDSMIGALKPFELHIMSLDPLAEIRALLPASLSKMVRFHGSMDEQAFYALVGTMEMLIPVVDQAAYNPSTDLLIGTAISSRTPVLLPESYQLPSCLTRPAVIRHPTSMSSILAIEHLRQEIDPRGKMARQSRVWDRFDTEEEWRKLEAQVEDTNRRALSVAMGGR